MNTLITGATGFLGTHLVKELYTHDYQLSVFVRKTTDLSFLQKNFSLEFRFGDLREIDSVKNSLEDIDLIFHNASVVDEWGSYSYFHRNNVIGTKNLMEAALNSDIKKIVYTSTADFYEETDELIDEDTPLKSKSNYHKSKIQAEKILDSYAEKYGLKITKIRPPGILGPRNHYMASRILNGLAQSEVIVIGSGEQIQSYVDARDVASSLRLAAENNQSIGENFNVTSSYATVKEYWSTAAEVLNKEISFKSYPYKIAYFFGFLSEIIGKITFRKTTPKATRFRVRYFGLPHKIDDSRIRKILNYKPNYTLRDSMRDMLKN